MTRKNRFTLNEQNNIFSKEVKEKIKTMEINGIEPPCCSSPLDINRPNEWCSAMGLCAAELGDLITILSQLFVVNEDISDILDTFHPDTISEEPHNSSMLIFSISHSVEKAISKTMIEIEDVAEEYLWLLEKIENISWSQIKKYSKDIFDEDVFNIMKENIDLMIFEQTDFVETIQQTLIGIIDENWNGDALFINKTIANLFFSEIDNKKPNTNIIPITRKK